MSVAYSNERIVFDSIRSNSKINLFTDLVAVLARAGWTEKVPYGNGFKYTLTSPEGYQCKVIVNYNTAASFFEEVFVQFSSSDGGSVGYRHYLVTGNGNPDLQIVVGICQLFISRPGAVGHSIFLNTVAGGLLARSRAESWWSCGKSRDFRLGPGCIGNFSYYGNGTYFVNNSSENVAGTSPLQIFSFTPISQQYASETAIYQSAAPLILDALVGWEFGVRGKLWDAFIRTKAGTLDSITSDIDDGISLQSISWHVSFFSTLHLITRRSGGIVGIRNYAY